MSHATATREPIDVELLRESFVRMIPSSESLGERLAALMSAGRSPEEGQAALDWIVQVLDALYRDAQDPRLPTYAWSGFESRASLRRALVTEFAGAAVPPLSATELRAWRRLFRWILSPDFNESGRRGRERMPR